MQVAVVGCGWLGLPLTLSLQKRGHNVMATCRSQQKAAELNKLGINTFRFELGDSLTDKRLAGLFTSEVLVLNIPAGRKNAKPEYFTQHMQALIKHAATSSIQNVIFVSTTSVYGEKSGIYTEQSATSPSTLSGHINLTVETLVGQYFPDCSTIIRPAGLVGKDRHPVNYLSGKVNLSNPDRVVNLIHQEDVVCAIQTVIEKELWGETLHLSALEHPSRSDYYTWAAQQLGLSPPSFVTSTGAALGKKIDASRSLQTLGLLLKYPTPFDMLHES